MESVIKLFVHKIIYKLPYEKRQEKTEGYGFLIDTGLVLTHFNLVCDAVSIVGRINKRDITLHLVGKCLEKKLAICRIDAEDISLVKGSILKFSDSMSSATTGISVLTNNENIKGYISGTHSEENTHEDSYREPCYLKLNFTLDSSYSGSPVVNVSGEVIGIFAKDNYAIPSRTFLAIAHELKKGDVKMPTFGLDWCKTSRELMKHLTGTSSTYGIYVRKVYPGSCLDSLAKGDVIRRIDYTDPFWNCKSVTLSNLPDLKKAGTITVFLDRFGQTTTIGKLKNPDESEEDKLEFETVLTDKKLELSEVVDLIPIGSSITLNMCRNKGWYKLKTEYVHIASERIKYSDDDYEIFAGMCLTNLTMKNSKDIYTRGVIIAQVFPETYTYKTQILKERQIIKTILGYNTNFELVKDSHRVISSLEDLRKVLNLKPEIIQITMTDESTFMFLTSTVSIEDATIKKNYSLK